MKGVIFDFNGTMVFDGKYHDLAWMNFSKKLRGYSFSEEEIYRQVHGKVNEQIIDYLVPGLDRKTNKKLSLEKEAIYREMCLNDCENYKLVDGLSEYMDYLKEKNIPFTIASASIKENIDFFVEVFQLGKWMDVDTIVYDDGILNNKEKMFLQAARNLNLDIKDCLIFEDSFIGIHAAHKVGTGKIIAIPAEKYRKEMEEGSIVEHTIENFYDARLKEIF